MTENAQVVRSCVLLVAKRGRACGSEWLHWNSDSCLWNSGGTMGQSALALRGPSVRGAPMKLIDRFRRLVEARRRRRALRHSLEILYTLRQDDLKDIGLSPVDVYAVKSGALFSDASRKPR